ncbi:hypothetical protein, partial [Brachyspira hampsonii]|uniref:hypothetical protein n=1 Tax=Brachyspira hampsonii TaxID=1287055 RepID=UPI001CA506B7
FAFGAITATETVFGDKVPSKFEAIEYYGSKIHFYEYDPIGYVKQTGEVVFYQHYKDEFVANPTSYLPKQHGYDNYAEHAETKPGKSPYVPLVSNTEASEEDKAKFENDIDQYINIEYKYRNYVGYQKSPTGEKAQIDLDSWLKAGYAGLSLTLYTYKLETDKQTLTVTEKLFPSSSVTTKKYKLSMINAAYKATYTNETDSSDSLSVSIVQNDSGENTISVSGTVLDKDFEDYGPIFVDRARGTTFKYQDNDDNTYDLSVVSTFVDTGATHAKIRDLTFKFNSDGTEFTMTYYRTHVYGLIPGSEEYKEQKFRLARFDSDAGNTWTAKYECTTETGTLGNYARVVFRKGDYDSTTNPTADEIGDSMLVSMVLHSIDFWESPTVNTGLDLVGTRVTQ